MKTNDFLYDRDVLRKFNAYSFLNKSNVEIIRDICMRAFVCTHIIITNIYVGFISRISRKLYISYVNISYSMLPALVRNRTRNRARCTLLSEDVRGYSLRSSRSHF